MVPNIFQKLLWLLENHFGSIVPFIIQINKVKENIFCLYREHEMMNIPFQFVIIALKHKQNTTNNIRNISDNKSNQDLLHTDFFF